MKRDMMTKHELIRKVAKREATDGRLPIYFHFADYVTEQKYADYFGMSRAEFAEWMHNDLRDIFLLEDIHIICSDARELEKARERGFVFPSDLEGAASDRWGCHWSMHGLGQELRKGVFTDITEAFDHAYPDPDNPAIFDGVQEKIDTFNAADSGWYIAQYYTLFERAWGMTGYGAFLEALYTEPEAVEFLLDKITDYKVRMAEKICEFNPTLGHTGDDFGLQIGPVMSLDIWKKYFKPRYEKIWGVYKKHGIPVMHHSCGDCRLFIEDMIDAGLDMLHPIQQTSMDINDVSERFSRDLSFFASIDTIETLTYGTKDDVIRNIENTVEKLGKHNGLLLGMINVMPNTPPENVEVAMKRMMELGGR